MPELQAAPLINSGSRKRKSLSSNDESAHLHSGNSGHQPQDTSIDPDADADFLALPPDQREKIDDAFNRGLKVVYGSSADLSRDGRSGESGDAGAKRRKVEEDQGSGESSGGGFMVEDEMDGQAPGGGGFTVEDDDMEPPQSPSNDPSMPTSTQTNISAHYQPNRNLLPYSQLPSLMRSLDLEFDDDVLSVFQSVAQLPQQGAGPNPLEGYTTRGDFRAVCAALIGPPAAEVDVTMDEDGSEHGADLHQLSEDNGVSNPPSEASGSRRRTRGSRRVNYNEADDGDDDDEDEYVDEDPDEDDLQQHAQNEDQEFHEEFDTPGRSRRRRPAKTQSSAAETNDPSLQATSAGQQRRLSREEKEWVGKMWNTMFEGTSTAGLSGKLLGKEQIKRWAELLGENWSDQELGEMIELFSTQPGKRGLGFDDFCNLLVRGGLI